MADAKYWTAQCASHGLVKVKQKTMPTTCKEEIQCGKRSFRRCGNALTEQLDVTEKVTNALGLARQLAVLENS
ncbi:hypothetical protein [Chitinibacter sp. S2-10]|uniref:hypothetical protein n=1 Tax=Chitinibacter sp. S2-10 TaxID=3373597 RepID=UPI0039776C22